MKQRVIEYERPYLYPKQEDIFFNDARYVFCEASTKAGKTHGCIVWIVEMAILGPGVGCNYWWVAPVSAQADIAFRRIKNALPKGMFRSHEQNKYLEFPNGARIWFKSAEKPDNLYGEDVYAAVLDEASRARHDSFLALRSTLTATRGPLRLIGNVKGKSNWFYLMCRNVERKQAADTGHPSKFFRLNAYDAVAGGVLELAEVEDAKSMLPEIDFMELYMAMAGDDEDAFLPSGFVTDAMQRPLEPTGHLIIGGDPSQGKRDPAAFAFKRGYSIYAVEAYNEMDEFGFIGYCVRLIESGHEGVIPKRINIDATGFGAMIVKALHEKGAKYQEIVRGFNMQQRSTFPTEYANKRAECWGEMRKFFTEPDPAKVARMVDRENTLIELTCIRKKSDSSGRLLMESKEDLADRGYESPNEGDACSLLFAEPVSFYTGGEIKYPAHLRNRFIS